MTFYNIIFGLVFVMSFFTTISILGEASNRLLLLSESILILLMSFNDIINTSDAVEYEKSDYPMSLKALDTLNFIFYMISIFAVQPKNKVSNIDITSLISEHNEAVFWIAVTLTFLNSFLWNVVKDKKLQIRYNKFVLLFCLFSLVMFFLGILYTKALILMAPIFLGIYFVFLLLKIVKPSFQTNED
jgi:hypothetical protein